MTWVPDKNYKWYESLAINIIKSGPVPIHIAFIMDGNRRYAKTSGIEKIDGHSKGFEKLSECLTWCLDIGVREVTTFAFSIENFKRSQEEVSALMDLATEKFEKVLDEGAKLKEKGVRIRVIGNISLLPYKLQQAVAKAMILTEKNDKLFINIALAYTSRDEITNSIYNIINNDKLQPDDITPELVENCLYTQNLPNPDLLIRTSGEHRISDFLMWQISATVVHFTNVLWPAITLWHFLYSIFSYQKSIRTISKFRNEEEHSRSMWLKTVSIRVKDYLEQLKQQYRQHLKILAGTESVKF